MKIKVSILNEFNTELKTYVTDLYSYELSKKHNILIEKSIDEMIHKIHFEQNFNKKNTEISNKSDSKKSEIEIKIGEYCECKSVCNEYENKTCKGVEKRKTNKIMETQTKEKLDYSSWRKKNTVMLIRGGWFGNQTPCYVGDARPKTEKEWKELYEQFKNK